jgi:hypothetical protein
MLAPNEGLRDNLDALNSAQTVVVHLISSPYTLSPTMTVADLTEASYPGYFPQAASGWSPATMSGPRAVSAADPLSFVRSSGSGGDVIYGYWMSDSISGPILGVSDPLSVPLELLTPGQQIIVIPRRSEGRCPT